MVLYFHTKLAGINVCSELELQQGYLTAQSKHACTAQDKLWHSAIATKLRSVTSKPVSANICFLTDEHSCLKVHYLKSGKSMQQCTERRSKELTLLSKILVQECTKKNLSEDWNTGQITEGPLGRVTETETEQLSDKTNHKNACRASICTINTLEHDTKLAGGNRL